MAGGESFELSVPFDGLESQQANFQAKRGFQQASGDGTTRVFRTLRKGPARWSRENIFRFLLLRSPERELRDSVWGE